MSGHGCGPEAHVHAVTSPLFLRPGTFLVMLDKSAAALCFNDVVAERVAALINEHGLLTVDDGMPLSWPPPAGPRLPAPGAVDSQ